MESKFTDRPLFLVGATAVGKSAVAMALARREPGRWAILCLDAMQVYRGADMGTGKPTAVERAEVPHGGLDLIDVGATFDVAHYLKHAAAFLREQNEAGRRVLIVGGTGLYFRALTRGLCEAPQGSDEMRAELAALSVAELQERLKAVDPEMLRRVDAANPRRLARAIEVVESTGKSLAVWQEETPGPLAKEFAAAWIQREKGELEKRIETRVEAMFAQGWVKEVRGLMERFGAEAVRNFAGIGYGEIGEAIELRGQVRSQMELGNERALKRNIVMATRQYAKRQLTWFAREPNLTSVMLTGIEPISEVLRGAALSSLL